MRVGVTQREIVGVRVPCPALEARHHSRREARGPRQQHERAREELTVAAAARLHPPHQRIARSGGDARPQRVRVTLGQPANRPAGEFRHR